MIEPMPATSAPPRPCEPEPLAVRASDAARLIGVSLRFLRGLDSSARIPREIRLKRAKIWSVKELRDWLAAGAPDRDTPAFYRRWTLGFLRLVQLLNRNRRLDPFRETCHSYLLKVYEH